MILLVAFVVIEGLAVMTKPTGDTLSAHAWAFLHNAPARLALVLSLTCLLLVRLIEIGGNQFTLGDLADLNLGRLLLVLGIFGWLTVHFLKEGKLG